MDFKNGIQNVKHWCCLSELWKAWTLWMHKLYQPSMFYGEFHFECQEKPLRHIETYWNHLFGEQSSTILTAWSLFYLALWWRDFHRLKWTTKSKRPQVDYQKIGSVRLRSPFSPKQTGNCNSLWFPLSDTTATTPCKTPRSVGRLHPFTMLGLNPQRSCFPREAHDLLFQCRPKSPSRSYLLGGPCVLNMCFWWMKGSPLLNIACFG